MSTGNNTPSSRIKSLAGRVLKYTLPVAVSVSLVVWLFHKVDMAQVRGIISDGVDWRYIAAMMSVVVLSHCIRGIRWGIQLRAAGIARMPVTAECVSILGAYALNIVFPFAGEAWRCVYVHRRQNAPLSTVVGTDIADRSTDGLMIGLFICLSLIVAHPTIMHFLNRYAIGKDLTHAGSDGTAAIWVAASAAVIAAVLYFGRNTAPVRSLRRAATRLWQGFASLFHMRHTWLYVWLTIGIWVCYFLNTYLCFFAFPFTRALVDEPGMAWGLLPGLVVFVFGSCSMIVPSNGGLGPWNMAVMFALTLYGIGQSDAAAYSIVCWAFQSVTLVAGGIFSAVYIMLDRRKINVNSVKSAKAT